MLFPLNRILLQPPFCVDLFIWYYFREYKQQCKLKFMWLSSKKNYIKGCIYLQIWYSFKIHKDNKANIAIVHINDMVYNNHA
jgi:hypothetical protein